MEYAIYDENYGAFTISCAMKTNTVFRIAKQAIPPKTTKHAASIILKMIFDLYKMMLLYLAAAWAQNNNRPKEMMPVDIAYPATIRMSCVKSLYNNNGNYSSKPCKRSMFSCIYHKEIFSNKRLPFTFGMTSSLYASA